MFWECFFDSCSMDACACVSCYCFMLLYGGKASLSELVSGLLLIRILNVAQLILNFDVSPHTEH